MTGIQRSEGLGKLAWVLTIEKRDLTWSATIGQYVEVTDNVIVEGIWDGPFKGGGFVHSDAFYGSGIIFKTGSITLVPSTALTDRIFIAENSNNIVASNSLITLMKETRSQLDGSHDYRREQDSILKGINNFTKAIPTVSSHGYEVSQLLFRPIEIKIGSTREIDRKSSQTFSDFSSYIQALEPAINQLVANARSQERRRPLNLVSTISKGYDSTFVTALLPEGAADCCYTRKRSSSLFPSIGFSSYTDDDGTAIADLLKLPTKPLTDDNIDEDELYFLASTPSDPETVFFDMYRDIKNSESPYVVFTGYHGDKVWERHVAEKYLSPDIIRGDTSGFGLSEPRIRAGFINAAIPFLFSESVQTINKISNLPEQQSWSINGDYDRPIPRRYLESVKGIPRAYFGQRKKAAIDFYNLPKSRILSRQFLAHIKEEYGISGARAEAEKYVELALLVNGKIRGGAQARNALNLPYKMHVWAINKLLMD